MPKLFAAIAAALMLATVPAFAQQQAPTCGPIDQAEHGLLKGYHEVRLWRGDTDQDVQFEITEAPDGATWTLIAIRNGVACLMAAGTNGALAAPASSN